jgi:cytochrome b
MQATPVPGAADAAPPRAAGRGRRVIDAPTRMFHWLFALGFAGAYLTAESERWRALHVTLGYSVAGLLAFRLLYGLLGPRQARLTLLWRKLGGAPAWLRSLRPGRAAGAIPWQQGRNLLMAAVVVLLLALAVPLTLSGVATYNEWGGARLGDALEEVHELLGNALLLAVLVHLGVIAGSSLRRRRNLALPMLTGRMPGPGPDLVRHNRGWLAALLLLAVLAFGAWQWRQSPGGLVPAGGVQVSLPDRDRHRLHDPDDD